MTDKNPTDDDSTTLQIYYKKIQNVKYMTMKLVLSKSRYMNIM